jgi:partner of Y14 and mago
LLLQVPQEEVPKYESKGKQWAKDQATYPVGLAPELLGVERPVGMTTAVATTKSKKKKSTGGDQDRTQSHAASIGAPTTSNKNSTKSDGPFGDIEKKLKACHWKPREIEQLQEKIDSGQLANPEKNQLEKLTKRAEIENEITELEETLERFRLSGNS